MEVIRPIELARIEELNILSDVRLIYRRDLNGIVSKDNLRVQFELSGELKGTITCYLCLDQQDLDVIERNYIFPLFAEAMNILVGRQISLDDELSKFQMKLSSPKLSMIPVLIRTSERDHSQLYSLELEGRSLSILTEYSLEALN